MGGHSGKSFRRNRHFTGTPSGAQAGMHEGNHGHTPRSTGRGVSRYKFEEEKELPGSVAAQKFKMIQQQILDATERAEMALVHYEIIEQEKEEQLQIEMDDRTLADNALTLTADDVEEMIPAANKVPFPHSCARLLARASARPVHVLPVDCN